MFFIDPPYTAAGKKAGSRLYFHNELDHEMLFAECEKLADTFLMTYDNAPEIVAMAKRHGFETRTVSMKNTHHTTMTELLVRLSGFLLDIEIATAASNWSDDKGQPGGGVEPPRGVNLGGF